VDRQLFDAAQAIIAERSYKMPDDQMLSALATLLEQYGRLSGLLVDEADDTPSSSAYRSRFGSLLRAYTLIGYTPDRDYAYVEINRALRALHPSVVTAVISGISRAGGHIEAQPNGLLNVNDEFTLSVVIARCRMTSGGSSRWHIHFDAGLLPDITLAIRMDDMNEQILDYYILPMLDMTVSGLLLSEANGISLDCYCFDGLDWLFEMAQRMNLREVA